MDVWLGLWNPIWYYWWGVKWCKNMHYTNINLGSSWLLDRWVSPVWSIFQVCVFLPRNSEFNIDIKFQTISFLVRSAWYWPWVDQCLLQESVSTQCFPADTPRLRDCNWVIYTYQNFSHFIQFSTVFSVMNHSLVGPTTRLLVSCCQWQLWGLRSRWVVAESRHVASFKSVPLIILFRIFWPIHFRSLWRLWNALWRPAGWK